MLENIVRHVEEGLAPFQAAIVGSQEVTGTIISMSLSLVAVFLPILLMGGIVGRVLNEFGMVVTLAILSSAVVSLTVTPMLAARLPHKQAKPGRIAQMFNRVTESYGRAVGWCLRHRLLVMLLFVLSFLGSVWSFMTLPRSFFPQEDTGLVMISTQARQDISYQGMSELQKQAAAIVSANPAVEHVTATLGSGPGGATFNTGSMFVQLKPRQARPPLNQTLSELRKKLAGLPGLTAYLTPVQSLRFGGRSTQSQYQIVLQSLDADEARFWSQKLAEATKAEPETFVDVASDLQGNALQAHIAIDNDKAGSLGITSQAIRKTLEAAYGTLTVSQIQATGNSYDVIIELDQSQQWDETRLGALRAPTMSGVLVPLASFATITRTNGPVTVNQTGQLASVTLSYNLPAGVSLGTATDRLESLRNEIDMPVSVAMRPAGAAQIFAQSTGNMGLLIFAAIATIYIVLGVLYESFAHPLTILSGLPSAAFGALATLQLFGFDFSIIALIGLLMLIGIVKKTPS
ncbi:RND transporter [Brucella melitensis 548]|nr:RND transporter [Brucella melitensis 548]